ncbi:MAG: TIGR03960 family B12-binding radical SAM protein [Thermogutta sp.]
MGITDGSLREKIIRQVLPKVQTPAQYLGGELNTVVKEPARVVGRLCLSTPDAYAIGMSNHGLQVLYDTMNRRTDWACERVFAPGRDMESELRRYGLALYSLETFTPLNCFDVIGFSLQYELSYTNLLTVLDLGRIPILAEDRQLQDPLVIAGGPCAQNPEPMSRFIDLFVLGDGEQMLPAVCDAWLEARRSSQDRKEALTKMARRLPHIYVPSLYRPVIQPATGLGAVYPTDPDLPEIISPAVLEDLNGFPVPIAPIVPFVEIVQDRIALEIMRGCPWRCRFCQSTTIKRPLRYRRVETLVAAAEQAYKNTGTNEIALLSLSSSDYPQFEQLIRQLNEVFYQRNVAISVPSLRVNEQLRMVAQLLTPERHSGLTLAPEVALDEMRIRIGKRIRNEDLIEGCKQAFRTGFDRVKLYFLCGLPGEREADLAGIVDLAEEISGLGRAVRGRLATVVANVSNFVPKPHTPLQWYPMQSRDYFTQAHQFLRRRCRMRSVQIKCHSIESSLLEGVLSRGDRRIGEAVLEAWRRGARFDSWTEQFNPQIWWDVFDDLSLPIEDILHRPWDREARLPWDHIAIRQGRAYLERECDRARSEIASLNS